MAKHLMVLSAFVLLSIAIPAQSASPQAPAALIVETSGSITPEVSPFSEVAAGTVLNLGAGAKLVFDDYYSCSEVTVTGGQIQFGSKGYKASSGAKASEQRVACKQEVVLKQGGEASTGLMRGLEQMARPARLGIRPSFVLAGARSQSFAAIKVTQKGAEIRTIQLAGPRFDWPADAQPLNAGTRYELALIPKSPSDKVTTMRFMAVAGSQVGSLFVIRVD